MATIERPGLKLDGVFEGMLVVRACESARFYQDMGRWLYPEGLKTGSAKLLLKAAQAIAAEARRPPASLAACMQHVLRWCEAGKVPDEDFTELVTWIDRIQAQPATTDEVLLVEAVPLVKRAYEIHLVAQQASAVGAERSIENLVRQGLAALAQIGVAQQAQGGVTGGLAAIKSIRNQLSLRRVSTGHAELDALLGGGLIVPAWYVIAAEQKAGKSANLSSIFMASALAGRVTYAATLELSAPWWLSRGYAAGFNVQVQPLIERLDYSDEALDELTRRYAAVEDKVAPHRVDYFASGTPYDVILEAVRAWEQEAGVKVQTLIIDYADKVSAPDAKSEYNAAKVVYEGFRSFCLDNNVLGVTASQATRGDSKREVVGADDLADSQHKIRVVDGGWSVNKIIDDVTGARKTRYFKFADRFGDTDVSSDDLDAELMFGRCSRFTNPLGNWAPWMMPGEAKVR